MNGVLVGNVSDHESRSRVISNIRRVDFENIRIVVPDLFFGQDIISVRDGAMINVAIGVSTDVNSRL